MTSPLPISIGDRIMIRDSDTAIGTVVYIPLNMPGKVKDFSVAAGAAVTTATETFQLAYAPPGSTTFTNITQGAVSLTTAAVAGTVARNTFPYDSTAYVQDGGCLRITPSGGAGGGAPLTFAVTVGN